MRGCGTRDSSVIPSLPDIHRYKSVLVSRSVNRAINRFQPIATLNITVRRSKQNSAKRSVIEVGISAPPAPSSPSRLNKSTGTKAPPTVSICASPSPGDPKRQARVSKPSTPPSSLCSTRLEESEIGLFSGTHLSNRYQHDVTWSKNNLFLVHACVKCCADVSTNACAAVQGPFFSVQVEGFAGTFSHPLPSRSGRRRKQLHSCVPSICRQRKEQSSIRGGSRTLWIVDAISPFV